MLGLGLSLLNAAVRGGGSAPLAAGFAVLDATGLSYSVPLTVLGADGTSYTVPNAVLTAAGGTVTPI